MRKELKSLTAIAMAGAILGYSMHASADERVDGKVVRTELTFCDFASHRCQGTVTLEQPSAKDALVTIRVGGETIITMGAEQAYLPTLKGNLVSVSYVPEKGGKLATSIAVLPAKNP